MVHIDAAERAAAEAILAGLNGAEFDLPDPAPGSRGHHVSFTALTLDSPTGELSTVNGVPLEGICRNDDCEESAADGDSYDGECASCADRTYAAELCSNDGCDEWIGDSEGSADTCDDCADLAERDAADRSAV
jgi:hypothetical protein